MSAEQFAIVDDDVGGNLAFVRTSTAKISWTASSNLTQATSR